MVKEKLIYEFFKGKRDDPVVEQSPILAPLNWTRTKARLRATLKGLEFLEFLYMLIHIWQNTPSYILLRAMPLCMSPLARLLLAGQALGDVRATKHKIVCIQRARPCDPPDFKKNMQPIKQTLIHSFIESVDKHQLLSLNNATTYFGGQFGC